MLLHNRALFDCVCQGMLDHLVILEQIPALLTVYAQIQGEVVELLLPRSRDIVITCVVKFSQGVCINSDRSLSAAANWAGRILPAGYGRSQVSGS